MEQGTIAARVAALREKRGLSKSELARLAGVHRNTITNIETGSHAASMRALQAVAGALGTRVDILTRPAR